MKGTLRKIFALSVGTLLLITTLFADSQLTLEKLQNNIPLYVKKLNQLVEKINKSNKPSYKDLFDAASLASALVELSTNQNNKIKFAYVGLRIAKRIMKDFPNKAAGYYYAALHLGYVGLYKGPQFILYYLPTIEKWVLKAIHLNPGLHNGSPLILACAVYFESPGYPVSIGNIYKGKKYCEEAIEKFPHTCTSYLYLAAIYNVLDQNKIAEELLEKAKNSCKVPGPYLENEVYYLKDKKSLKIMLNRLKKGESIKDFMKNR